MENKKEIYTPMEQVLVQGAIYAEALETKKKANQALALDLMLLEMEAEQGLMDGLPLDMEGANND